MQVQVLPRVTVQDETRLKAEVKKIREANQNFFTQGASLINGDEATLFQ